MLICSPAAANCIGTENGTGTATTRTACEQASGAAGVSVAGDGSGSAAAAAAGVSYTSTDMTCFAHRLAKLTSDVRHASNQHAQVDSRFRFDMIERVLSVL